MTTDPLEQRSRELLVGLATGDDGTVEALTSEEAGNLRGAWDELTATFGAFEGIDEVEFSGDTAEVTFDLAAGEFLATVEFEDGTVTDFAVTKADGGGLGLLVRLGVARLRGILDRLSPFEGKSRTETARELVRDLDTGAYEAVYADLSPIVRSELSAEEFASTVGPTWESKVGTVESFERVEELDGAVFVVVEGSHGLARVAVQFAPDGAPLGVALASPEQAGEMVVSRILRGQRYEDLADVLSGDPSNRITETVADTWEAVLDVAGDVESVGEPTLEAERVVGVPVSATDGEFVVRVELDVLLRIREIAVGDGPQTEDSIAGTTLLSADALEVE